MPTRRPFVNAAKSPRVPSPKQAIAEGVMKERASTAAVGAPLRRALKILKK